MVIAYWALSLLGHAALWTELVNRLHGLGWRRSLIDALTLLCGVALVGVPAAAVFAVIGEGTPRWVTPYSWLSLAALALIIAYRAALAFDTQRDARTRLTRRDTLNIAESIGVDAACTPGLARIASAPGNELLRLSVEHLAVPIDRLPAELDGLRIAHLTDLHMSGRLRRGYFEQVVQAVNSWGPDLVMLTGDIVEHTPQLDWVEPVLGAVRPEAGAFFILGNHDEKVDSAELRRRLSAAGWSDVGARPATLTVHDRRVTVCGDERPWFPGAEPPDADDDLRLALVHTPDRFAWARSSGVDLTLAGHNHGGQVCFPVLGPLLCPSRHGVRYASGTFRAGRAVMHVGRGTGSLFPIRWNCPPELTLITLERGDQPGGEA